MSRVGCTVYQLGESKEKMPRGRFARSGSHANSFALPSPGLAGDQSCRGKPWKRGVQRPVISSASCIFLESARDLVDVLHASKDGKHHGSG